MFLRWYRRKIAEAVEDKMRYLYTCLNERDMLLHIIAPKDYKDLDRLHCNTDCSKTECQCYSREDNNNEFSNENGDNMRDDVKELLDKANNQGYLSGFDFSVLMQRLLISKDGYVIDTGNYENVNAEVALRLVNRIKKHPLLWELFFMVA